MAYKQLRALADKFGGVTLAQVAAEVRVSGHFDKVIHMIENMILKLKEEGEDDIKHRERCETKQDKNKKKMEDLNFGIDKLKEKLERFKDTKKELETKIKKTEKEIETSEKTIKEMKDKRAEEFDDFSQATKDDLEAIALIQSAIDSLSKFYKENNIKQTNLLQGKPEKAPDTWEDDSYGGRKSESGGILAMIKEDLEREVQNGKDENAASQVNFANDLKALEDALDGEKEIKEALEKDCKWIETDFDKRAKNRKLEIKGLKEAKHFLGGAVVLPPK